MQFSNCGLFLIFKCWPQEKQLLNILNNMFKVGKMKKKKSFNNRNSYFLNSGFISDNTTLDKHISTVCHSAYVKIRCISYINQYLTVEAAKTPVCAFVLSKLDYWILFYMAAQFTVSVDDKKFITLQKNWFSKHTNMIISHLFCKLFTGYQSKPEQTTNCQLSVMRFLLLCSKAMAFAPILTSVTFGLPMPSKHCHDLWFLNSVFYLPAPPPPQPHHPYLPSLLITFLWFIHMCVYLCWCGVWGTYNIMTM